MSPPHASILVVDDDERLRAVIVRILGRHGHRMTQAQSGEGALEALHQGKFDLVILDLSMPGMGGGSTAAAIRAAFPDVEILVVSGAAPTLTSEMRFVQKPFTPQSLTEAVDGALRSR